MSVAQWFVASTKSEESGEEEVRRPDGWEEEVLSKEGNRRWPERRMES